MRNAKRNKQKMKLKGNKLGNRRKKFLMIIDELRKE